MEDPYLLEFDIAHCEGNFNCIGVDPVHFLALPGGEKSDVPEGAMRGGLKVLDLPSAELEAACEAARVCPPQVIRVRDKATGQTLAGPATLPQERPGRGPSAPSGARA